MIKHWTPVELTALRRMRQRFLDGTAGAQDYWKVPADLALYDSTFAERIGWKWDAVLRELAARDWQPRSRQILDWGCGSGIAGRRVLAEWPQFSALALHDRSVSAMRFAAEKARLAFAEVAVNFGGTKILPDTLLVLSHVISELPDAELARLLAIAREAAEIIWVEAGTHADSRRLISVRERLLGDFVAVAPCTHQHPCGMLSEKNARHWCHHFAAPPAPAFQDARWAEFGREMEIDLRSLPYSFLVLEKPRTRAPIAPGFSRVIGDPREAKGHLKVLSCHAQGVGELVLQKRDAPDLFKHLRKCPEAPVYRWALAEQKIVGAEALASQPPAAAAPAPASPPADTARPAA